MDSLFIIVLICVILYDIVGLYGIGMLLNKKKEIVFNFIGLAIPNLLLIIAYISGR